MAKLEMSEVLKRKVRSGSLDESVVPNWILLKDAIKAGKTAEALEFTDYIQERTEEAYVRFGIMANEFLTFIAANVGEEAIEKIWRARYKARVQDFMRTAANTEQFVKRINEAEIGHHSVLSISEEADRFVVKCDPCGSGGRMRRAVAAGTTQKAYPWTWGRAGVAYYCTHCALEMEILPIEMRGYPLAIVEYNEKPDAPCVRLYYKSPELIPEKYFTRVGQKRDVKKFKPTK
ncbi:MAG: hypothetical protein Q7R57_00195 [Dehalococcoidales bacterium]|nr:hypothetical protein [Dehalococcoidales bacterium]